MIKMSVPFSEVTLFHIVTKSSFQKDGYGKMTGKWMSTELSMKKAGNIVLKLPWEWVGLLLKRPITSAGEEDGPGTEFSSRTLKKKLPR